MLPQKPFSGTSRQLKRFGKLLANPLLAKPLLAIPMAVATIAALPVRQAAADETLKFGVYTAVKPSAMIEKFSPVTKQLGADVGTILGTPAQVKMEVAASYQDGIKNLVEGKVDFSRLGPASLIEAMQKDPKLNIMAVESSGGTTVDYGVIAVKEDSPIKSVEELKGKTFAFGEELSTIGRYLSQSYLLEHGIKAADLGKYEYLGRHDAVGAAVGAGRFDAGALKEEVFKKLKASGTPIREIARFQNAPQSWVASSKLDPAKLNALKSALLGLKDPAALKALEADQLVEGKLQDFDLVRDSMAKNPEFFKG